MFSRHLKTVGYLMTVASLVAGGSLPGSARNQWDINHGASNPPVDPRFIPGGSQSGYVPQFSPDFWKGGGGGAMGNQLQAGTVLTAVLEDNLSSAKSKSGDRFALTLNEGFVVNNRVMIPPNSRIVGTVTNAVSAKARRMGNPGSLDVSLQALVFPDGNNIPIYATIAGNPNHAAKGPPKIQNLGASIADYGQSVASMGFSFVSGSGYFMNKRNRGMDFSMNRGDAVPIRLSRSLEIPAQETAVIPQQAAPTSWAGIPGAPSTDTPGSASSMPAGQYQQQSQYEGIQQSRQPVPGLVPNAGIVAPTRAQTLNEIPDPF